jgi:hypothetical protein
MKKIILVIAAVALLAPPALAVDWNFYGSARMATFWTSRDYGDGLNDAGTDDSDADLQWALQGNSRLGATVKAENVGGRFELGLKGNSGGDVDVGTRRIFGTWDFGAATLKVGKDYTPVSQFISGQVFDADLGLLGIGTMYGNRTGQISLSFGGFEVALIDPNDAAISGLTTGDIDTMFPKIEAKYGMSFDTWNFNVRGGYQHYEVEDATVDLDEDIDVDSWIIGGDAGVNFGPAYVKGAVSYGQNVGNAAWNLPGTRTSGGIATFDGTDDIDDVDTLMWALVGGFKFTDQLTFEVGFGWREDQPDANDLDDDDAWELYGQAVISLAPGVWVIPEIGYSDFGDGNQPDVDEGDGWYAGAKWQIDF